MTKDANPQVLMCSPEYFGVNYVINPWMDGNIGVARKRVAVQQWTLLKEEISKRASLSVVESYNRLPDMCFVANAGLLLERVFVPSVFRVPQRVPEVPHYRAWFEQNGYQIADLKGDQAFEGEGDALFAPGEPLLWAGYGVRSSLLSHRSLSEIFNIEVLSLRLVDERFYHLDTCFAPLDDGRVMYYPAAFDRASVEMIRQRVPSAIRLEVGEEDALNFCCNCVPIGNTIITNYASPGLRSDLANWGYDVVTTPLSEFILAGGSAKCLCLFLQHNVPGDMRSRSRIESSICSTQVELSGHLLDVGLMNRALDLVTDSGGSFCIDTFMAGQRHDQPSLVRIRVTAPTETRLDEILSDLSCLGARCATEPVRS